MAKSAAPIVFRVTGQSVSQPVGGGLRSGGGAPALALPGELKAGVRVGARRAGGAEQKLQAVPGEDVVVLHIASGPSLVLHPETARDLLLGQGRRCWCCCTAPSSTPSAPSASCGRCTRRRWRSCSTTTASVSTRWTTRRWRPARSPTR
jgi:hypothetical protein